MKYRERVTIIRVANQRGGIVHRLMAFSKKENIDSIYLPEYQEREREQGRDPKVFK